MTKMGKFTVKLIQNPNLALYLEKNALIQKHVFYTLNVYTKRIKNE